MQGKYVSESCPTRNRTSLTRLFAREVLVGNQVRNQGTASDVEFAERVDR